MSETANADEAAEAVEAEAKHAEAVRIMYELQRDLGRQSMQKAMAVLDQTPLDEIPVNVAVQLLKFGAEIERRAILGIEPEDEKDPFDVLSGSLDQT